MFSMNQSSMNAFILLGFSDLSFQWRSIMFLILSVFYMVALLGNILIIILTTVDPHLNTPMYFFLWNLSILEMCYTSVTIPRLLMDLLKEDRSISFPCCALQLYFFIFLGSTECFLFAVMAYDRYAAIVNPLRYTVLISRRRCLQLVIGSWVGGIFLALGQAVLILSLPYCRLHVINHFFCDVPPLVKLACGDKYFAEIEISLYSAVVVMVPFVLVLLSYVRILDAILKIRSSQGQRKAFSTCASHLTSVFLFYVPAICVYVIPKSKYSLNSDRLLALFYAVIIPMLNPLIYSLRNKEVKGALRNRMNGRLCPQR
ncbi:olfactory receptor 5V1-like [Microcaecilia unicolor]|uniref:Olfactory receptor 5V1-like n=1 Tax=Microcaecilia unicolor TaxID=1415580 RepID=A0A6P7WQ61_9AMPH|nr:olfactory receptor 5V1-like [Microcaecilia unicolor]